MRPNYDVHIIKFGEYYMLQNDEKFVSTRFENVESDCLSIFQRL